METQTYVDSQMHEIYCHRCNKLINQTRQHTHIGVETVGFTVKECVCVNCAVVYLETIGKLYIENDKFHNSKFGFLHSRSIES